MTYSAALFTDAHTTLEQAQAHKIERLLEATGVQRGTRVLEIGTGWGELALRAARRGARVTSVTLSHEQARLARHRVAAERLSDMVDIRVQDYRDAVGSYDAIVSVEMIEAVGERWWPAYFQTLDRCLAPGGRVGLQAITMAHERLLATRPVVDLDPQVHLPWGHRSLRTGHREEHHGHIYGFGRGQSTVVRL